LLRLDIPTPDEDVKAVNNPTIEGFDLGSPRLYPFAPPWGD
jgi:hypothetical protein